jgi:glycosyl transferase, family 25
MSAFPSPFHKDEHTAPVSGTADALFLYINMERSHNRRAHMEKQLQNHGLRYQRIEAVNGIDALQNFTEDQKQRFFYCHGKNILAGELGCYLSHLRAMQHFLSSDAQTAVIMEDDAQLPDNLGVLWASLSQSGLEWDFLRLQSRRNYVKLALKPLLNNHSFCLNLTRSTGSTAYALNRKAATTLLDKLGDIQVPFDHAFDQPQHFGLKYRHLHPDIIGIASFNSTIEVSARQIISHFGKIKTLLWRGETETMRFLWSIQEYIREKARQNSKNHLS